METANRAATLVAKIEQRAENARLIAPTYVELSFKDMPVEEAVAELAKKSGYAIIIGGDKTKLSGRKVTCETGKVPFWKALEMLCEKAELVESDMVVQVGTNPSVPPSPPLVKPLPIRRLPPQRVPEGFSADEPAPKVPAKKEVPQEAEPAVQPAQPVQVQVQPNFKRIAPIQPARNIAAIVLVDGKAPTNPMHVEGAIRIRAVDSQGQPNVPVPQGEFNLSLEVKAEPKIQVLQVVGVKIDKAVDNHDQHLDQSMVAAAENPQVDGIGQIQIQQLQQGGQVKVMSSMIARPIGMGNGRTVVPVRLKKGEKESKSIKELQGTVSLKIRTPAEEIVAIENIMKAKGESAKGKNESTLKIIDISTEANGDVKVEVELQHSHEIQVQMGNNLPPQGVIIQGNVQIQIAPNGQGGIAAPVMLGNQLGLEMVDSKGTPLKLVQTQQSKMQWQQNGRTVGATLTFHPEKDQQAAKLAFKGTRIATAEVPFVLKDLAIR